MDERITLTKLQQLKQRAIQCGRLEELEIEGLTLERALVFPSGLAILIAIFTELNIQCMTLAGGALREGLVYGMLHLSVDQDIRSRTLRNVQRRFIVDTDQAQRVAQLASLFADQVEGSWALEPLSRDLLLSACALHEVGLSIDFKHAPLTQPIWFVILICRDIHQHRKLLATLLLNQTSTVDLFLASAKCCATTRCRAYVSIVAPGDSVCQPSSGRSPARHYSGCRERGTDANAA